MDALVLYWSKTGNTEKLARAVVSALESVGFSVVLKRTDDAGSVDFFQWDLVCIGVPSYRWHPPEAVDAFLVAKFNAYRRQGRITVGAPRVPGKYAMIFCTYSGQHTGLNEATPAGKYMGQFFEHLGFTVLGELYVVGEYHGSVDASTQGRLGDIRGRPNESDLERAKQRVIELVKPLHAETHSTSH